MSIQSNLNQLLTIGSAGLYAGQTKASKQVSSDKQYLYELGKVISGDLQGDYKEKFEESQKKRMFEVQNKENIEGESIRGLKKTNKFIQDKLYESIVEHGKTFKKQNEEMRINDMKQKLKEQQEKKNLQRLAEQQANEAEQRKQLEIRKKWMQGVREEYGKR